MLKQNCFWIEDKGLPDGRWERVDFEKGIHFPEIYLGFLVSI